MKALQYTIRNVPPDVDNYLRREAARLGVSLNKIAVGYLSAGAKERIKIEELVTALNQPSAWNWLDEFIEKGTVDKQTRRQIEYQAKLDKERMKRGD